MAFTVPTVSMPFPGYKWRWMEVTPVESFNRLDVLLGVTRAIASCEGEPASGSRFNAELAKVQSDLLPNAYDPSLTSSDLGRNVLRRQGRYWRGLGILSTASSREMRLTKLGRGFASGEVTPDDFVRETINSHVLPNRHIDSVETIDAWRKAGLHISPLKLLIAILVELGKRDRDGAYLTAREVARVIIPLCISTTDPAFLARGILEYRVDPAKFASLPNCAPGSNDMRMVREHLLFLAEGGIVRNTGGANNETQEFRLGRQALKVAVRTNRVPDAPSSERLPTFTDSMVEQAIDVVITVERTRRSVDVVSRPAQAKFRKQVLKNCGSACVISGETVADVLIACHVHEVWENGSDLVSNGIMLRADLHVLFDNHKLRVGADGTIALSPDVASSPTYAQLPDKAKLPLNLNQEALRRRFLYGKVII